DPDVGIFGLNGKAKSELPDGLEWAGGNCYDNGIVWADDSGGGISSPYSVPSSQAAPRADSDDCSCCDVCALGAESVTNVITSIANMENGLRKLLDASTSIVQIGVAKQADPENMSEYNDIANELTSRATDLEEALSKKLDTSVDFLKSYQDLVGCDCGNGGGPCVEEKTLPLCFLTQTDRTRTNVMARYTVRNDKTGETNIFGTDNEGAAHFKLPAGTYDVYVQPDSGAPVYPEDLRKLTVDAKGNYQLEGATEVSKDGTCIHVLLKETIVHPDCMADLYN
ncbi:MAG: hypothetical protein LBD16_05145, partial [Oscillospiraceae bacterium]|nr:hypothetical protein [Oscillospiraceae bacterium]